MTFFKWSLRIHSQMRLNPNSVISERLDKVKKQPPLNDLDHGAVFHPKRINRFALSN